MTFRSPSARDAADPGPDVRRRILGFVKKRDRAFVGEVAEHFRIGHEGARKQLVRMERDGWLKRVPDPEGVGRPRDAYSVALAGDRELPKAYDRLSVALMSAFGSGSGTLRDSLSAMARAQVEAWKPRLEGKTLPQKLAGLRDLYGEDDPFMSVEQQDGDVLLVERNCPFLNVALEHPALCSLTVNTLEGLLGHPVVREKRFQNGDGRCVFRVLQERKSRGKNFRLESERETA